MGSIFLAGLVLGVITAMIANSKGRNPFVWWFYGAMLWPIALVHSLLIRPENSFVADGMKKCPSCAEMVKQDAKVCRYCSRDLPQPVVVGGVVIRE